MSSGYNKATIVGHLGKDPELRYTASGTAVCNMTVATTSGREGNEHTEWHRIVTWGKLAEICGNHLKKGSLALFEGEIRTRKWQDNNGGDRYSTEINAQEMKFLTPKGESTAQPKDYAEPKSEPRSQPEFDDIPF